MDYASLIEKRRERFAEVEKLITDPDLFSDQKRASETMREHRRLKELLEMWDELENARTNLQENEQLAKEDDPEIAEMAEMEIPELQEKIETLSEKVQYSLLPADPNEDRDALLEIRAGAGGDEASLFAGELMRMYERHAETRGWKIEHLDSSPSEVGGFKEVVLKVSGEEVFRFLKYESGVHRVQRVPATETQGRIHTSTVTVAVMPEAEEVDIVIRPEDLHIQATRSGGPGGQHVNTTDSAVQITHLPTGLQVKSQDGRSQTQNKEKAMEILRTKLYEAKVREEEAKYSAQRRALIGSGDRSEKIRTYNFPQSRVTDHRINYTSHNIEGIMSGAFNEFTDNLQKAEMEQRLAEANMD
ncbi:bacterial peptide chain release factor 1 (bRF-1) [Rubritalea squalenifaciens DSM 18772]|uniref:Peptide chain release factor 1 n=2 Tax=Rubritalea TaxID=361050 RepID=A0A1M6GM76_9BACT|nr:peptide chain release factor 1 [Rubritalea squalenifaciens]SHJ11012.1 bacterial peptide chain release factor 1 (bRF-1) [Rubritalea squalenifaciens DSM 18772]